MLATNLHEDMKVLCRPRFLCPHPRVAGGDDADDAQVAVVVFGVAAVALVLCACSRRQRAGVRHGDVADLFEAVEVRIHALASSRRCGATCTHALAPRDCNYCSTVAQVSYMKRV